MKMNDSVPPQMSGKSRFAEITKIMAKGFRRLHGEWDDPEDLTCATTVGSNGVADLKDEENLSDCLDL